MVDKGQKLSKWGPSGRVSQRLSMKERGTKVLKKKKKVKKESGSRQIKKPPSLYSRESEAQLMLQVMAHSEQEQQDHHQAGPGSKDGYRFVPTGPGKGSGSGVYFIDFSDDYKRCLRKARAELEQREKLTQLEKQEMNWINDLKENRAKPLGDKLIQLKVSIYSQSS